MPEEKFADRQNPASGDGQQAANDPAAGADKSGTSNGQDWFKASGLAEYGASPQEVAQRLARNEERLRNLESKLNQQGEDLGQARQEVLSSEQIARMKADFHAGLQDPDQAWEKVTNLFGVANRLSEEEERQRHTAYDAIYDRNPELRDISYDRIIHAAYVEAIPLKELTRPKVMQRVAEGIRKAQMAAIDPKKIEMDAYQRGLQEGRKESAAKGVLPASRSSSTQGSQEGEGDERKQMEALASMMLKGR